MRLPSECYQMQKTIETHLPHLSQPQLTGLALWVCGAILAGSACQNAVASALSPPGQDGTAGTAVSAGSGSTMAVTGPVLAKPNWTLRSASRRCCGGSSSLVGLGTPWPWP